MAGLFNDGAPWDYETDDVLDFEGPHFGYLGAGTVYAPYWLIILDGEVIAIEQQYIPQAAHRSNCELLPDHYR